MRIILETGIEQAKRMTMIGRVLTKLGLGSITAARAPIRVFLLDDDARRHRWFTQLFDGDQLDIAETAQHAIELLSANSYDAVFLDHDLLPEHYHSDSTDDERTGYAVAAWLAANPHLQPSSTVVVHTRNADGAMRMVSEMRNAGRPAEYVPFPMLAQKIKNFWQR